MDINGAEPRIVIGFDYMEKIESVTTENCLSGKRSSCRGNINHYGMTCGNKDLWQVICNSTLLIHFFSNEFCYYTWLNI